MQIYSERRLGSAQNGRIVHFGFWHDFGMFCQLQSGGELAKTDESSTRDFFWLQSTIYVILGSHSMEAAVAAAAAELGALRQTSSFAAGGRGGRSRRGGGAASRSAGNSDIEREGQQQQDGAGRGRQRSRRGRGGRSGARTTGNASDTGGAASGSSSSVNGVQQLDLPAPATQVTHRQGHGGPRYRSQLSSAGPASDSTEASSSKLPPPSAEELAKLTYRERLTVQLNTSSIDCPICINNISRKQPISSCRTCSAPYHLKCLRDWAERSIATVKEKAAFQQQQNGVQIRANWRCPSCQTQYAEHDAPRNYWCYCGRLREPRASGLGNAHSCEKPCKRERPEGCEHS